MTFSFAGSSNVKVVPVRVTSPSGSAGAEVSAQQAHRNTSLLNGSRLLESQSCDGLQENNMLEPTTEPGLPTRTSPAGSGLP